jgi:hypothetical protein
MARENQGLHIALIIFVMLTVILGVTTFFFFREYEEAVAKAAEAAEQAKADQEAARNILDDSNTLKQQIGWSASDKLPDITRAFNDDMDTYAANFDPADKSYRKVIANLAKELQDTNAREADALAKNRQWQAKVEQLQGVVAPQVAQYKSQADKAATDLKGEQTKFQQERAAFTQKTSQMQGVLAKAQQAAVQKFDEFKQQLAKADERITDLQTALIQKTEIVNKIDRPQFDVADGKIRWVNQREGTVWINLGLADNLPNLSTFAVYDAEINDITAANSKADIQVIQLLGDHLAEARITADNVSDPIMPGDLIHTPIWAPGQKEHFALTDGLDINGDGKSDLHVVRNLLAATGAEIDAVLDENGDQEGKMDGNTRFLVIGTQHDEKTDKKLRDARKKMLDQAEELGVRTVTLKDLLKKTGWKEETPVVTYGKGADPDDFRAKPPEGVPRRSTGNIFKPREVPRSSGRTTY